MTDDRELRWIGISGYIPPCVDGVWEDGAIFDDTGETLKQVCLYLKGWINKAHIGEGSAASPFESWLDGEEIGDARDGDKRLLAWNRRCKTPLADPEVMEIGLDVNNGDRSRMTCAGAKRCPSLAEYCDPDDCRLCSAPSDSEKSAAYLESIADDLRKDPTGLDDPQAKAALRSVYDGNRLFFDLYLKKIGPGRDAIKTLKAEMEPPAEEGSDPTTSDDATPDEGGYSGEVLERARRILDEGDPVAFLMDQYHRNHRGDETMGKGWFCSFASGQSLTSSGIQPAAHSEDPGMGKTDSGKAAFHCIHTRADLETSVSAMSLYRDKTLKPGDIVFSDDVEWSRALASTVKRSMSNFQRETNHKTLDKDNELQSYSLPPRLLWWFTSVESSAIDQIIDRQFLFDVDNSEEHHHGVNDDIKARRASGDLKFDSDDDILTARAITFLIKKAGPFKVSIPFARFIAWKLPRGHRDLNRFLDLIDALAILRYPQRSPREGEDGTTWLTATIEDYREAKRIFASRQKNIRTHLTDAETRLITVMVERANWTQAELAERTGHKQGTISKRLSSLLEKSSYVKSWNEYGEKRFATTDKVDLSLFASDVVGLNPPTARSFIGTDSRERYSTIFHTYSYLIPISIPILTNSSRNNSGDLFHNPGFSQGKIITDPVNTVNDDRVTEDRNKYGISFEGAGGKSGINPENQQQATDSTRNKSGIRVEYDGITLADSDYSDEIQAEALEIVAGLNGRSVTFGNVEAYLESRTGAFAPPTAVKRVLNVLASMGWATGKDGILIPPAGVVG